MKLVNKVVTVVSSIAAIAMLASCGSTSGAVAAAAPVAIPPKPESPAEVPTFTFTGSELKIEVESMFFDEFLIVEDAEASGYYAGKLMSEESVAKALVTFPAGTYVGLVNEKAPDGQHDAFNVFLDGVYYRSYPSDPPLGTYELTTRTPINFTIDADKTVELCIQQNDPTRPNKLGETGMYLDYIVFQKQ